MVRLAIHVDVGGGGPPVAAAFYEIFELTVTLTGSAEPDDIAEIYVYWEEADTAANNGTYDRGENGEGPPLGTLSDAFAAGESWDGNTITIPIGTDNPLYDERGDKGYAFYFVAVDFIDDVDTTRTAGIQVSSIGYVDYTSGEPDPTNNPRVDVGPYPATPVNAPLDDYETTLVGDSASLDLGTTFPGSRATLLRLDFGVADASLRDAGHVTIESIRLKQTGTAGVNDVSPGGVRIYRDNDSSGSFTDGDTVYGTASLAADGYVTVNLSTPILLSTGATEYYVAADIAESAAEGNTLGFQVENPAVDIVFTDGVIDMQDDLVLSDDFGFPTGTKVQSFEYDQIGFIVSTNATPEPADTVLIAAAPDLTPPRIIASAPEDGEVGVNRNLSQVRLTFDDVMYDDGVGTDPASVTTLSNYSVDGPTTVVVGSVTFNSSERRVTLSIDPVSLPLQFEGLYTVTVENVENTSGTAIEPGADDSIAFTVIAETPPTVVSTSPEDGRTNVPVSSTIGINFSEPMNESTVTDPANFSLVEQATAGEVSGTMTYDGGNNRATFTPDEPLSFDATYVATVTTGVLDAEGSALEEDYVFSFTTVAAPTVTLTTPEDGETGVPRNTNIRVVFDTEMATINPEDVTIVGSGSGVIDPATDGAFSFNATTRRSFTFTRSTPYVYEETVTVTVSGTVTDNSGNNPMGEDYVFSFQIAAEVNPTILGTVPSDGSGNVALASTVSLIFSQSMDEATVTDDANFTLVEEGSETQIAGTMTYNDSANTATFTPDETFDFDTTYVATVTTGMRDTEGSALEQNYTFSFSTVRQIGDFRDAIVANNRIAPDSGEPMRIFVEVPAGSSATDIVTIQVFTATGRRVATLTTAGETYEDVIARQPILWNGTNGRGQDLGPGLYFVQVTSTGFRKAMRVLIVR